MAIDDVNKTVLEMEISRVKQSSDIITYAINERTKENISKYEPKKFEGEEGKRLSSLLEEGATNADEWIAEIKSKEADRDDR